MTTPTVVLERVQDILAETLRVPPDRINADSSPETLPLWDSLQHLTLVVALEQEFGVGYSPDEIEQMTSVRAIADITAGKEP